RSGMDPRFTPVELRFPKRLSIVLNVFVQEPVGEHCAIDAVASRRNRCGRDEADPFSWRHRSEATPALRSGIVSPWDPAFRQCGNASTCLRAALARYPDGAGMLDAAKSSAGWFRVFPRRSTRT